MISTSLQPSRSSSAARPRQAPTRAGRLLILAALATTSLAGCRSSADKANAYEAQYDRMMAVQAYPAAFRTIQRAVKLDDSSARRFLKLAEVEMALSRPALAATAFQSALDLEPDNIEALQNLSILAVRSGQYEAARRYIDPLLQLSPDDQAGLLASGALALGERRYKDATKLADRIIGVLPDRADGYVIKARALDAVGRTRAATAVLEERIAKSDDDKDLLIQLMAIYRKSGDKKGIRATAIRLMPLFPDDPRYALESARAFQDEGKRDQVRTIIDGLTSHFANNPDVLLAVGAFWRDTQPLPVARSEIAKLAASAPARVRTALADQLIDLGEPQEALSLLASLAPSKITPGNVDGQTHFARALLATGQPAKARAKVDAVLAYDAANPEALLVRSRLRLIARDYRGAFTDAQLVTQDDRSEEALLLVAEIYAAQGNELLAAGAYGNARQQFPASVTALKAEVNWLLQQHRNEEAGERVAAFYHAHPRSGPAQAFYQQVCRKTRAIACGNIVPGLLNMLS